MSRELRHVEVTVTVLDCEHLPAKDGQQMYADDVVQEIRDVMAAALTGWYEQRGHDLLAYEPDLL
ncbi:hypothetical protein KV557_10055 [Kitasatospora aureofaciens]|uniref:hypothetical protein n=1 Tax=Kitasatospora aureofaciens TaxID=1894 RepID=UPI001C453670|nr:hypothetical protein [Kitasatospora aureofaciens]MBV6697467.1 hypothetical protein [Kitasatospora aureofaciens]